MTLFLLLAAGMVLTAIALVVVPLLRPRESAAPDAGENIKVLADSVHELEAEHAAGRLSADEFAQACARLERAALEAAPPSEAEERNLRANWGAALATAIALPLLAVLMYAVVGQPGALHAPAVLASAAPEQPHASDEAAIAALLQRLERNADDAEGWTLLARSYFQMRRLDAALDAYRKARALRPDDVDLLVETANTLAISRDRDLDGEPEQLIARALQIAPDHPDALVFAGLAAFQRGDRAAALQHWRRLEAITPEGSEDRDRIGALIARAQADDGLAAATDTPAGAGTANVRATRAAAAAIHGTVTLDDALASHGDTGDSLFIFAREPGGPPMPLAAVRLRAADWPVAFTLDDSSAMVAERALSRFPAVQIVARVSRRGSANAEPGDVEGRLDGVAVGSSGVRVVLDRVVGR